MTVDRLIRIFAGIFILLSLALGVEGSPVTVVLDEKSAGCALSLHVRDLPLYDYREALRPSTRLGPPEEEEYEEEG